MNAKLVAIGSAVVLALCGAGGAAANAGALQRAAQVPSAEAVGTVLDAALAYLQLDKQTFAKDLQSGQSLAQIAVAQGKTADGLVNAAVTAAKAELDAAVAAGKLDSAKEQVLLTKLRTALTALVNRTAFTARQSGTQRPLPVTLFLQPLLNYVRLHLVTVPNKTIPVLPKRPVLKLGNGTSIAQIAVSRLKASLDAQVAAGRLTAVQEAAFLAKLQAATTALVGGGHS